MMSSYVVWWGQLPLVKDGAGCKNHHTEALLNQSTGATDTPQIDKRDEKNEPGLFSARISENYKDKNAKTTAYIFSIFNQNTCNKYAS